LARSRFNSDGGLGRRSRSEGGFSLIEVMLASGILATALIALAQLFVVALTANTSARSTTYATVLAEQKVEELRGLTWGFDSSGLPITDTTSDTASTEDDAVGGTGLTPSPETALQENTDGYVDYVDIYGNKLGGGENPPQDSAYIRRWSIEPLPTNPNNTIVIQVMVTRRRWRGAADEGAVLRLPEEARLITVKTRKAQ
jgi:type II secretory pathway pseudopilin PulG